MGKKRETSEINSSSMADIAFLLLIFFLVTTSMSTSTGLSRRLPPPLPPDVEIPPVDVNKRNLFVVKINSENKLLVQNNEMHLNELRAKTKEFIKNEGNEPNMPVRTKVNIPLLGEMDITKDHVISLQNDVDTQYQAYLDVQNELVAAYNELRNELSKEKFGVMYNDLDEDRKKAIQAAYPQKISEAEPKNYGRVQ